MSRPSAALCLETAVEVAAEAAVHALGGGGAGIGAFLLAGRAPILRDGLSDELHLAVLDALPLLAQELRRSGHPIRIPAERVPDEHATLRSALGTGPAPGLAAFPLFGDVELVACLVAPLPDWRRPRRGRASWRVGARAIEALQAAALSVALDGAGLDPRWLVCEPLDGLVVLDRRGRVVLARGLLERVLGARSRPVIGLKVADVPGADLLAALPPSTGEPRWGAHVLPVEGGEEIPVALAAWTLGPRPPGTTSGRRRTSASGCVVLARERTGSAPAHLMPPGLATAAHLARLQGLLERTLAGAPEHPAAARLRALVAGAEAAAARLDRAATGGVHAPRPTVDAVVRAALDDTVRALASERIRLFELLECDRPVERGHALALHQVARLLVDASRAALRPRGGSLTVRSRPTPDGIEISVSDDGADSLPYDAGTTTLPLFETDGSFARSEVEAARALVERRGGTLLVESRPGLWTRTTVLAPFAPSFPDAAWGPAADGDRAPVPAHDPEGSLSILVVDDNPALRSVVRRFLERRGHRVAEAADGDEALGMVRGAGFDRLVVDVRMPGTDGPALYEALGGRARTLRDRVVFMTGAHVDDGTERFLAESGRPCIRKPFDLELLARAVEEG